MFLVIEPLKFEMILQNLAKEKHHTEKSSHTVAQLSVNIGNDIDNSLVTPVKKIHKQN